MPFYPSSDCSFNFFAGPEATSSHALIWIGSPVAGLAAHAGGALAHHQDARPPIRMRSPFLSAWYQADQVPEHALGLFLRHLVGFREICREMLHGDGRLGARLLAAMAMDDPPQLQRRWP